jgi:glyoxylase-like metal-dependent hydrolase (beta-lactamase superfamily II)
MFGFKVRQPPPVDRLYCASPIKFGDYEVRVHHTPGHCPGGVCLQIGPTGKAGADLFVGDTLFAGSIGRSDLPGGDYAVLMRSITEVLFPLGDAAIVHPGHGPDTTIGRERTTNPFVLEYLSARSGNVR